LEARGVTLLGMSERHDVQRSEGRAIRSPLTWAVLGLVIERPSHGHELAQRFRHIYGETLALGHQKDIYRLLDTLHTRELIEETGPREDEQPARNRLPKLNYRATERGVRAYEEWLLLELEEERQRQRLFARQLAMLEPGVALEVIDRYEEECLTEADEASPAQSAREVMAERLADQDEQLALQARLSWIRYARHELAGIVERRPDEGGDQ
jgi:DNA-binding PadR family transcriptional regulator